MGMERDGERGMPKRTIGSIRLKMEVMKDGKKEKQKRAKKKMMKRFDLPRHLRLAGGLSARFLSLEDLAMAERPLFFRQIKSGTSFPSQQTV